MDDHDHGARVHRKVIGVEPSRPPRPTDLVRDPLTAALRRTGGRVAPPGILGPGDG
ncbi:hypothetical protein [Streptomyces sp. NPDC101178]|uniref:hypothetical protein n=1 Tax=Streptomyces sp. NPDC101178 TaxID=3366124 RepID=UPI00380F6A76